VSWMQYFPPAASLFRSRKCCLTELKALPIQTTSRGCGPRKRSADLAVPSLNTRVRETSETLSVVNELLDQLVVLPR
jgi:hypothetical protein